MPTARKGFPYLDTLYRPEIPCSYLVFVLGSYYYAKNGTTGMIDFGGEGNIGEIDGTDSTAVAQAAIDAVEVLGKGKITIKCNLSGTTSLTVEESNIIVEAYNITFTYTGNGHAVTIGSTSKQISNSRVIGVITVGSSSGLSGFRLLEVSSRCTFIDCTARGFTNSAAFYIDGGSTWTSICSLFNPASSECKYGIQMVNTVHAIEVHGGYLYRTTYGIGTKAVEMGQNVDNCTFFGTYFQKFVTGIDCDGNRNEFYKIILEDIQTTAVILGPNSYYNGFYNPTLDAVFTWTDNGTNNFRIGGDSKTILKKLIELRASSGNQIDVYLGDDVGANSIVFRKKDGTIKAWINSNGQITCYGGIQMGGVAGTDIIKDPSNYVDATLSGTPKIVEIKISGVSYYFKVYPTKT